MQKVCHPDAILCDILIDIVILFMAGIRQLDESNTERKKVHPYCAGAPQLAPETVRANLGPTADRLFAIMLSDQVSGLCCTGLT